MEKIVPRIYALPGVKAIYRNGELIYRDQGDTGIKEDNDLHVTRHESLHERV